MNKSRLGHLINSCPRYLNTGRISIRRDKRGESKQHDDSRAQDAMDFPNSLIPILHYPVFKLEVNFLFIPI
ncbi:hypothetical protein ACTXT7_008338 [Hymenolepis weldensis]